MRRPDRAGRGRRTDRLLLSRMSEAMSIADRRLLIRMAAHQRKQSAMTDPDALGSANSGPASHELSAEEAKRRREVQARELECSMIHLGTTTSKTPEEALEQA